MGVSVTLIDKRTEKYLEISRKSFHGTIHVRLYYKMTQRYEYIAVLNVI
jgi:hypothetical protein